MNELWMGLLIGVGIPAVVSVGIALFGKFLPKQETYDKRIKPVVVGAARGLSKFLNLRLGKASAEKIEEGIIVTLAFWLDSASRDFITALTEDNK